MRGYLISNTGMKVCGERKMFDSFQGWVKLFCDSVARQWAVRTRSPQW